MIGTTSTEEKAEIARKAGADHVILYGQGRDVVSEVYKITGGGTFAPAGHISETANWASDFYCPGAQRGSTVVCTACLTASARTRSIRTLTSSGGRGRSSRVGTLRAPSRRSRRSNSDPRTSRVRSSFLRS